MKIRCEKPEDRSNIATIIARTYGAAGAHTIELTGLLRSLPSYDAGLGFIGEDDGSLGAFALYTPLKVGGKSGGALLAPIAIDTANEGINLDKFMLKTMEKVANSGNRYIFLLGNTSDYIDLGFKLASEVGMDVGESTVATGLLVKDMGDNFGDKLGGTVELPEFLR